LFVDDVLRVEYKENGVDASSLNVGDFLLFGRKCIRVDIGRFIEFATYFVKLKYEEGVAVVVVDDDD
jgi:hypothetical protein